MGSFEGYGVNEFEVINVETYNKKYKALTSKVDNIALVLTNTGNRVTFVKGQHWAELVSMFNRRNLQEKKQYALMGVPGTWPSDVEVILYHIGKSLLTLGTDQVDINDMRFDLDDVVKGNGLIELLEPLSVSVSLTSQYDVVFYFESDTLKVNVLPLILDENVEETLMQLLTGYYALFRGYK